MNASWHVLLVDDDGVFRATLANALTRRGHRVSQAGDVASALRCAQAQAPDAVVLDLRLADESGLRLIEPLLQAHPHARILLLTGYASIATAVEAIKLGAVHYLPKPASVEQIMTALGREDGDPDVAPAEAPLSVDRLEWEHIQQVLTAHDGNLSATARALKMHRRTLQRKLAKRPVKA